MAFTPTTWVDGSAPAITAAQLNRIEAGIDDAHAGDIDAGAIGTAALADGAVTDAKVATGIDAAKIGGGTVSNTEFERLNGVTSAIQTQLNAKAANTVTVTGTGSLTGGGDLTSNRTIDVSDGGIDTSELADGAVTAAKLDSQAVGVDPVFAADNSTDISVPANTASTLPAGVWYGYWRLPGGGLVDTDLKIQVYMGGSWRTAVSGTGAPTLLVSDGTNVRFLADKPSGGDSFYRLRQVWP